MEIYKNIEKQKIINLLTRPAMDGFKLEKTVKDIIMKVRLSGDKALFDFASEFDSVELQSLAVATDELTDCETKIPENLKKAIDTAYSNIYKFHENQKENFAPIETMPGVKCWRKSVPIQKVGIYVPGGTAPLFSTVLMLAVPAKIAGCEKVIMCTPPSKDGKIHPAMLYAAKIAGVTQIFKTGGAQAIAAMAYGTQTISAVDKIFGPGNQYVTTAKMIVSADGVAIDMPAGPSEVMVVADESANPSFVAADLLSQAEHGTDSQSVLLTTSSEIAEETAKQVDIQLAALPRKDIAAKSIANSKIFVISDIELLIEIMNTYAPEHLILSVKNYNEFSNRIVNAGSVFLGNYTPESAGDYASGTNHTLPTNGYARAYSGVSLDSYFKKITFQEITKDGLKNIGRVIETMAQAEQLDGHKNAVTIRLKSL